jgi:hypothetical protein
MAKAKSRYGAGGAKNGGKKGGDGGAARNSPTAKRVRASAASRAAYKSQTGTLTTGGTANLGGKAPKPS